ncbi:MAG: hypothetical protein EI684_03315 [Candidatus Viridilinea halotolerans]|uniref:Carboxypeptidase regulatory-like domain-containing protein n=1 Tax=Candidatus Viridilinea halotolerans TaxID=2491704 RepID=A0A426U837_9CHLR|nr:MAG: hypothetical protein EI684_03315 [Candidatus Viridilinea halotolerans]
MFPKIPWFSILLLLLFVSPVALLTAQTGDVAQVGVPCQQVLVDPTVTLSGDASPWVVYAPTRSFATEHTRSEPFALGLSAGAIVGQPVTLPSNVGDLFGRLWYRYAPASNGTVEQLRVELYRGSAVAPAGLLATVALLETGDLAVGDWRELEWNASNDLLAQLSELENQTLLLVVRVLGSGGNTTQIWLDDLALQLCQNEQRVTLRGVVTYDGEALVDAQVALSHTTAEATRVVATTRTDATGAYGFPGVVPLAEGARYRIWYLNAPLGARMGRQLGFWAGPELTSLPDSFELAGLNFDVGDVTLFAPEAHVRTVFDQIPALTLRWLPRSHPLANERHRVCLYDPARGDAQTGLPQQWCSGLLDPARDTLAVPLRNLPGFVPEAGRAYHWYVTISQAEGPQYGVSFYERVVRVQQPAEATADALLGTQNTTVPSPLSHNVGEGAGGEGHPWHPHNLSVAYGANALTALKHAGEETGGEGHLGHAQNLSEMLGTTQTTAQAADWTLLVYLAGDNALGDAARAEELWLPEAQLAVLPSLATAHPGVRLVSLVDRLGTPGVRICAYVAENEPQCEDRATASSSSATTLGDAVAMAREQYPAQRTALLVIAPGNAVGELAYAEATGQVLRLSDLQAAFQSAGLGGNQQLDLVIYQVPLFGTVDGLRAMAPYARFMVAAPDQVWQVTPYEQLVGLLAATNDAAAAATGVVARYAEAIPATRAFAMAAYDLSRVPALGVRLDALADALATELLSDQANVVPAFHAARTAAPVYDASGNGLLHGLATDGEPLSVAEDALLDLQRFVVHLSNAPLREGQNSRTPEAAQRLAALLLDGATTPVLTATLRSGLSSSGQSIALAGHGLAILLPSGERLGGQPALAESYFALNPSSSWTALLRVHLSRILPTGLGGITEGRLGGPHMLPLPGGFLPLVLPDEGRVVYLPLVAR